MNWFGPCGDAPAFQPDDEVLTPVGDECLTCSVPIVSGDAGVMMPTVRAGGKATVEPMHVDCLLDSILGPDR